jgi:predicted  nucleic acid-binding Zn-ribbon protein
VSSVKEQLNTLVELQDTEIEIKSLERELAGIGARVEAMLAEKATYEQKLQDSRDKLEGLKKQYRSDESEIQMIDNQIVKSKEKLRAVKTNKEYQSTLKEIDDLKAKASTVEDGMLDTLDKIEAVESEIALQLSDLEDVAQEVAGKQEEIREQGKKQEKALALLYGQRDAILAGTDEKLKEFYGKGGKSEHHRAGCSITWSRGDAKASATESKPPRLRAG